MVHKFKYERQFWHASKLSILLAGRIDRKPDLITSVPLHWTRYWWRGFNQSEQLAMALSRDLDVEYRSLFRRVRATPQQQGLSKKERESNMQRAFELRGEVKFQHVAIVDDVLTTGSTVTHLCQLLLDAKVKTVDIYCVCRTPEPRVE
jgi:ComF family protein